MTFEHLPSLLSEAITARGYEKLTPVQDAVSKEELAGKDLIVSAQTGSGKTVAFGLAMAGEIMPEGALPRAGAPLALIIAPTRELALQVSRELSWLYAKTGARIATCVGGMDQSKERRNLSKGVHIIVGTPGRLRDHLERGALVLSNLRVAVLDEADEMLDMGFREELEEILDATPDARRTLMFSATMPRQIENLARRYQKDSKRISTVGEDRSHTDITYQAMAVAPPEIEHAVVNLLRYHDAESAMLFCSTRDSVRRLHASLSERGFSAVSLSGENTQNERNAAMQALRDKRARVCVATDVAARGIDLPSLSLVVHVELPRDHETLKHRSGRTGRAGKKGTAVLITPYPRRKKVERMLRDAKVQAEWVKAPSLADIAEKDRERLIETLMAPVEVDDGDRELGKKLLETKSAEDIAAALVFAHRSKMPAAEEMLNEGPRQVDQGPRAGFEDTVWFSMDVGRNDNADPRWILPLLCRRGHITKNEIGAIRISDRETVFEVPRAHAGKFADALNRTEGDKLEEDRNVHITQMEGKPRDMARQNRKSGGKRHEPRRFNDGFNKGAGGGGRGGPSRGGFGGDRPRGGGGRPDRGGYGGDRPRGDRPDRSGFGGDRPKRDFKKSGGSEGRGGYAGRGGSSAPRSAPSGGPSEGRPERARPERGGFKPEAAVNKSDSAGSGAGADRGGRTLKRAGSDKPYDGPKKTPRKTFKKPTKNKGAPKNRKPRAF